ncbi:outer membrane protein with beta-barrel domain [Dyadobacter jejuensis]|uniref:Outer membrane protein with beta-barrel domain n=1 Tax=Dyadobacter jejuensis TaxID=1082580 RepID=A0A316AQJ5_9BACT|nr:porin family protein [Dyadobacter jejuensis]PWJ59559.1 outer membrane protein with beta-barrel domain [Dyadobacter jejuensis]
MKTILLCTFLLSATTAPVIMAQTTTKADKKDKSAKVIENTVVVDTVKKQETIRDITERVVETTYKNYPQQAGQPTIIINNIILPPDYQKNNQPNINKTQAPKPDMSTGLSAAQEDEEYQAWLRERRYRQQEFMMDSRMNENNQASNFGNNFGDQQSDERKGKSLEERLGERPARNSGMWIIPMVGLHAQDFDTSSDNDEINGRAGWNAGLDFRIRANRFFVQPGVHYFNSSLEITEKDSVEQKSFTDGPRIHTLKVPMMVGVYLTKANSGFFKFNVKGGIVGNYLLSVDNSTQTSFSKDNLNEFYYGANAGIGLEFGFITLDVSHEWGISKFVKSSDKNNNVLRATIGFKI